MEVEELAKEIDMIDRQLLKEHSLKLQQILREMEDYQLKILALQVEAQFVQNEMQDMLESRRLARLSERIPVAKDMP